MAVAQYRSYSTLKEAMLYLLALTLLPLLIRDESTTTSCSKNTIL